MQWNSPVDAVPWVGLYVCVASLICTLAMAADALHGFRQWKLWFPCRYFTINAASITLLAIAMKLPVDLNSENVGSNDAAKLVGIIFLVTVLANFLPSLGLMDDKQLLMNIVALGILIVTITVNVWIEYSTSAATLTTPIQMVILIFFLPLPFSVALTVSASRRILHHRYEELHKLGPNHQEIKFSYKRLMRYVKRYWMMAETGNPQFAIASSPVSYALGVICLLIACISLAVLISLFLNISDLRHEESDYKWSIAVIVVVQLVGAIVGSIAPIFRFLTATSYFNLSKKWSKKHLNVFRVEKQYIQRVQLWKRSPVPSYIPGRHCKKIFYTIKNMTLNLCIALQITVMVMCNTICFVPRSFLILLSCSYSFFKSLLKRFKAEPVASSSSDMRSEMEEYSGYVLQIEVEPNLSKRILRNTLKSISRHLHESEKKEPSNLMKLLKKSTGFYGVAEFDNDQVPPLHQEETQNCWSLVLVTLTAIALALPNTGNGHKWLLSGMREGLQIVMLIEESLNGNRDLVKSRKAARRVWTDIEVYRKWLEIELQKKSRKGEKMKDILRWLGDEAIKIVIEFKRRKNGSLDQSLSKFIAASSMYRISQTIVLHCEEQENWPKDEEIFEFISTIIADLLLACFTNLPRVITMKCHDDAIEKREDNIRIAAQLLGKSKKILKILKARKLPNIDLESMAYIDKWHVLPKSQLPDACSSSARIQSPSTNSSISLEVATDEYYGSASRSQRADSSLSNVCTSDKMLSFTLKPDSVIQSQEKPSLPSSYKPIPDSCQKEDNDSKQTKSVYTFNHTYPIPTKSQQGMELHDGIADMEKQIRDNGGKPEGSDHFSSITRFDICPRKINTGGIKLKTSLLEKNREKKKKQVKLAAEGPKIIILKPGMVFMKGYISCDDQVKIVKTCRELGIGDGGFYQPGYSNGAKLHFKMMCLGKNWDPQSRQFSEIRRIDNSKPPKIPDFFHEMVKRAIQDSNAHIQKNSGKIIPKMSPDICIAKFYTKDGKLGLHQDKDESRESLQKGLPVVSFSIGDTGEFLYGNERDIENAEKVNLESGDVLIFGGESRHIFHGVSSIAPETAPKSLLEATDMRDGRLNLTFRQF